jgi:hypothetical protein
MFPLIFRDSKLNWNETGRLLIGIFADCKFMQILFDGADRDNLHCSKYLQRRSGYSKLCSKKAGPEQICTGPDCLNGFLLLLNLLK